MVGADSMGRMASFFLKFICETWALPLVSIYCPLRVNHIAVALESHVSQTQVRTADFIP